MKTIRAKKKTSLKKKYTRFRPLILTRHPSQFPLREQLPLLPFRSVVRLGSTTPRQDDTTHGGPRVECNTVQAVRNSADKLLMKQCFSQYPPAGVKTAKWWGSLVEMGVPAEFPIVIKHRRSSRGEGIYLIKSLEEYNAWKNGKTLSNYIAEKFYDYSREYRLHVTANGCFYTCRKVLKEETPDDKRWIRNDSTCNWIMDTNPLFDKPVNWDAIVAECVKAVKAVGLDFGACDVKVQSAKDKKGNKRSNPEFIVIEINSAPSFGEHTLSRYLVEIPKILKAKKSII